MKHYLGGVVMALAVFLSGCRTGNTTTATTTVVTSVVAAGAQYTPSRITDENLLSDVLVTVTPAVVTESEQEFNVTMTNTSDVTYQYGVFTHLDVLVDGAWVEYPLIEGVQWIMIAYWCEPGATVEFLGDLDSLYGKLPAGKYRLAKELIPRNELDRPSGAAGYALAEFEVKP